MPLLETSDSDEEMYDAPLAKSHATPPPVLQKSFTSKADLMSGIVDDDLLDYDFDEDSDDSELEIYGKMKSVPLPQKSIADPDDDGDAFRLEDANQELDSPIEFGDRESIDQEPSEDGEEPVDEGVGDASQVVDPAEAEVGDEDHVDEGDSDIKSENAEARSTVKQDDHVSIKSEDDNESIHYGNIGEEDSSTINVAPSTEATPSSIIPSTGETTSPSSIVADLPFLDEAPTQVQTLLQRWFEAHGRKPPPCARWTDPKAVTKSVTGRPVSWYHVNGQRLTPIIYRIPDLIDKPGSPHRRIIVLQSAALGPYIVGSAASGGTLAGIGIGGSKYKVWYGVDSGTSDGFELEASIWKGVANHDSASNSNTTKKLKPAANHSSKMRTKSQNKFRVAQLPAAIPTNIQNQLEQWMSVHGRKIPPCTSFMAKKMINQSHAGKPAVWWHLGGEQLELNLLQVRDNGVDTPAEPRLLVAWSSGVPPMVVRYKGGVQNEAIGYRVWHGLDGDESGFESGCSVFKVITGKSPSLDDLARWHTMGQSGGMSVPTPRPAIPQPESAHAPTYSSRFKGNAVVDRHGVLRKGEKSLRPRDSITKPAKFLPTNLAGTKRPNYVPRHEKRKRHDEEDDDGESLLHSFMSPAAEHRPAKIDPVELLEHINHNVVLLFFPRSGPPRVRLLGSCDNVQKLFAQALAGDVFSDSTGTGTKVLALTFGGGQNTSRSLVEDDDQDFDDLIVALKGLDCWAEENGVLQGSLTVEVRAK